VWKGKGKERWEYENKYKEAAKTEAGNQHWNKMVRENDFTLPLEIPSMEPESPVTFQPPGLVTDHRWVPSLPDPSLLKKIEAIRKEKGTVTRSRAKEIVDEVFGQAGHINAGIELGRWTEDEANAALSLIGDTADPNYVFAPEPDPSRLFVVDPPRLPMTFQPPIERPHIDMIDTVTGPKTPSVAPPKRPAGQPVTAAPISDPVAVNRDTFITPGNLPGPATPPATPTTPPATPATPPTTAGRSGQSIIDEVHGQAGHIRAGVGLGRWSQDEANAALGLLGQGGGSPEHLLRKLNKLSFTIQNSPEFKNVLSNMQDAGKRGDNQAKDKLYIEFQKLVQPAMEAQGNIMKGFDHKAIEKASKRIGDQDMSGSMIPGQAVVYPGNNNAFDNKGRPIVSSRVDVFSPPTGGGAGDINEIPEPINGEFEEPINGEFINGEEAIDTAFVPPVSEEVSNGETYQNWITNEENIQYQEYLPYHDWVETQPVEEQEFLHSMNEEWAIAQGLGYLGPNDENAPPYLQNLPPYMQEREFHYVQHSDGRVFIIQNDESGSVGREVSPEEYEGKHILQGKEGLVDQEELDLAINNREDISGLLDEETNDIVTNGDEINGLLQTLSAEDPNAIDGELPYFGGGIGNGSGIGGHTPTHVDPLPNLLETTPVGAGTPPVAEMPGMMQRNLQADQLIGVDVPKKGETSMISSGNLPGPAASTEPTSGLDSLGSGISQITGGPISGAEMREKLHQLAREHPPNKINIRTWNSMNESTKTMVLDIWSREHNMTEPDLLAMIEGGAPEAGTTQTRSRVR